MEPKARYVPWFDILPGLLWGAFFSLAPIAEVLFFGAILWVPVLLWIEIRSAKRRGLFPGVLVRAALTAGVVAAAIAAPLKHEDTSRVGPFSSTSLSLEALAKELRVEYRGLSDEEKATKIELPSTRPLLKDLIGAVESRTRLRYVPYTCANGMTLLRGGAPLGTLHFVAAPSPQGG